MPCGTPATPRPSRRCTLSSATGSRWTYPFSVTPQIEVSRRIDRGSGSAYRVNDREVRARDVQLLFADAATGAPSAPEAMFRRGFLVDRVCHASAGSTYD